MLQSILRKKAIQCCRVFCGKNPFNFAEYFDDTKHTISQSQRNYSKDGSTRSKAKSVPCHGARGSFDSHQSSPLFESDSLAKAEQARLHNSLIVSSSDEWLPAVCSIATFSVRMQCTSNVQYTSATMHKVNTTALVSFFGDHAFIDMTLEHLL
jgi:hypothetical protein